MRKKHMETKMIHNESCKNNETGSLTTPIYQTSTFSFASAQEGARRFAGEEEGYIYSRLGNPTVAQFEERMAALEGGEKGLAFASGMGAVSAVLIALTKAGDHIVCSNGLYGCTYGLLKMMEEKYGITHDFCSMETEEELKQTMTDRTACIFVETPINPTMKVIDLEMVSRTASSTGAPVVVDNTFCTPYLQRPLDLGCDVVVHSATKYIGGHGDVVAGVVVGSHSFMEKLASSQQKDIGGILSPFDAWLLIRGMKTMHLRMDRHSANASEIAARLIRHPRVKHVHYPGFEDDRQSAIVQNQMKAGGGVIAFELNGGREEAEQFINRLNLIKIAVSLGDAETLIQHPASMTHAVVPEEQRNAMGIHESLIRISVGLEAVDDIWYDLYQSLSEVD
ncbi:methionine gamma-lyase [Halobacillus litoralis]|uniref:L-methionine gamma-lyase n=1 Tax=Halobacillus litoralis TaxID=45668 RepID=A0A845E244_9BACI|nr:methionine gamma-lyase [Halobacillus litoralis]MYL20357.1 methionine gamma-lyase [Halobacillus litoralis]